MQPPAPQLYSFCPTAPLLPPHRAQIHWHPQLQAGQYQSAALGTEIYIWSQAVLAGGNGPPGLAVSCACGAGPQPQSSCVWGPWWSNQVSRSAAVPGQVTMVLRWGTVSLGTWLTQHRWDRTSLSGHWCPPCWGTGCCQFTLPGVMQHIPLSQPGSGRNFPFPNGGWGKACVCNSPLFSLPSPVTRAAWEGACHICL